MNATPNSFLCVPLSDPASAPQFTAAATLSYHWKEQESFGLTVSRQVWGRSSWTCGDACLVELQTICPRRALNPVRNPAHDLDSCQTVIGTGDRNTMGKLAGKVAVVTAPSKGIGASIAAHLAAEGASVVSKYASRKSGPDAVAKRIREKPGKHVA